MRKVMLSLAVSVPACSDDGLAPEGSTEGLAASTGGQNGDGDGDGDDDGATAGADDSVLTGDDGGTGSLDDEGGSTSDANDDGVGPDGPYCPDVEPWPKNQTLCTMQSDCDENETCDPNGPPQGPQCGMCFAPDVPCVTDDECADLRMVCAPFFADCACSPGELGCAPPCDAGSCAEGETCQPDGHCGADSCLDAWKCEPKTHGCDPTAENADAHGCVPIPCDAGWRCDAGWVCDPTAGVADEHGCSPTHCNEPGGVECEPNFHCDDAIPGTGCGIDTCTSSRDCDCGTCVEGLCRDAPGVCVSPPPP